MERAANSLSLDDPAAIDIESRIRAAVDGYGAILVPLIADSYGRGCMQQAWHEFMLGSSTPFTGDNAHSEIFFSWFFHCWSPSATDGNTAAGPGLCGIPPTRAFLQASPGDLNPLLRAYLEACLESRLSFYQITACRPGTGVRAWDMLNGAHIAVFDNLASDTLRTGDITFARVLSVNGISLMDAIAPISFPSSFQKHFAASRLGPASGERSDPALRKLYFDLLEIQ